MSKHHRINFVFLAIISVFLVTGFMARNTFAAQFTSPLIAPNSPNCHGSVGDFVWNDLNGNGIQDAGEPGLSGVTVSLYNTTPSLVGTTTTDSNGNYLFSGLCESGVVYYLVFDKPATYNFTLQKQGNDITIDSDPDPITGQTDTFTLNPGDNNDTLDAGLAQMDFGDLPSGYSNTLLANDGARHVMGGLILGEGISADSDGNVSPTASGDTFDDGVVLDPSSSWQPGNTVNLTVTVTGGDGYLAGWFDWNNDGALDAGEMTISQAVSAGSHSISLIVPNDYTTGQNLFSRFRLYPPQPGTIIPTGMVANGEDEDYLWTFKPTAIQLSSFSAKAAASSSALPLSLAMIGFTTLVAAAWFIRKQQD
jgi:hypothetical protein